MNEQKRGTIGSNIKKFREEKKLITDSACEETMDRPYFFGGLRGREKTSGYLYAVPVSGYI